MKHENEKQSIFTKLFKYMSNQEVKISFQWMLHKCLIAKCKQTILLLYSREAVWFARNAKLHFYTLFAQ